MPAFWQVPQFMPDQGQIQFVPDEGPLAKVPRITDVAPLHQQVFPNLGMDISSLHLGHASPGFQLPPIQHAAPNPWASQAQVFNPWNPVQQRLDTNPGFAVQSAYERPDGQAPAVGSSLGWNSWQSTQQTAQPQNFQVPGGPPIEESQNGWGSSWNSSKSSQWHKGGENAENSKWQRRDDAKASWGSSWNAAENSSLREIDWAVQPRKPFRREFIPYGAVDLAEATSLRSMFNILIEQDPAGLGATPKPIQHFREIKGLPDWVLKALEDNQWDAPTSIQAQALPICVAGRDIIAIAQTGSGKTGAFLLPALLQIEDQPPLTRDEPGPIALILAPTRELAVQISDEAAKLMKYSWESSKNPNGFHTAVFYGGGRKRDQLWAWESTKQGAHIVVATPGRLLDFLGEGKVSLLRVTYLVLDEADRMLDMGFAGDVRKISSQVRPERQTLFFSATWSAEVQLLARDFCSQDPVRIRAGSRKQAGQGEATDNCHDLSVNAEDGDEVLSAKENITQEVVVVDVEDWQKGAEEKRRLMDAYLRKALTASEENKILVFVNEKKLADELVEKLCEEDFKADSIHGGRRQEDRLWVLDEFRKGNVRLLVATDVLGRGIDIPNVSHVVIFEMGSVEGYIHRIGRTCRGKETKGHALVFFEYFWKLPQNAANLIKVLTKCKQHVPPDLTRIAEEVTAGKRDTEGPAARWSAKKRW